MINRRVMHVAVVVVLVWPVVCLSGYVACSSVTPSVADKFGACARPVRFF